MLGPGPGPGVQRPKTAASKPAAVGAENLVRPARLPVPQFRDPPGVVGHGARPDTAADFRLGDPVAQCLGIDAQLTGHPGQPPARMAGSRPSLHRHPG